MKPKSPSHLKLPWLFPQTTNIHGFLCIFKINFLYIICMSVYSFFLHKRDKSKHNVLYITFVTYYFQINNADPP